jgi:urease accessory protein
MTIVEHVHTAERLPPETAAYTRDRITLPWEDRRHGHGRRLSDAGTEFGISLPTGTVLRKGDFLVLDPERVVVAVEEIPEPVYVIRPATPQDWAFYAYQIGNRHQPVEIGDVELICPRNAAIRSLFEQLHAPCHEDVRSFNASVAVIGHSH